MLMITNVEVYQDILESHLKVRSGSHRSQFMIF